MKHTSSSIAFVKTSFKIEFIWWKKQRWVLILIILGLFQSCNNTEGDNINFQKNQNDGDSIKNNLKEGVYKFYDESGHLKSEESYKGGVKHGICINYYPNGDIESKKNFVRGYKLGSQYYYINNNELSAEKEFVKTYYDSSKLNTWKVFQDGKIVKDSSRYYKLINPKSTLKQNEEYELKIKLESSFYNQFMGLRIVNYNEEFQENISPEDNSVINCKEFIGSIKIDTKEKGDKVVRFIILDYKIDKDGYYLINNIFGEYKYKVG